jgi:hypothetical protein
LPDKNAEPLPNVTGLKTTQCMTKDKEYQKYCVVKKPHVSCSIKLCGKGEKKTAGMKITFGTWDGIFIL